MSLVTRSAALRDGLRRKEGIVILLTRHLPLARFARLGPYRAIFSRAWRRCKFDGSISDSFDTNRMVKCEKLYSLVG